MVAFNCGLRLNTKMNTSALWVLLFTLNHVTSLNNDIIDFDLLESIQNSVKDFNETEFNVTFSMYIQAAGFDDLVEKYSEKVKQTVEKRIQDALILK